MDSFTAVPFKGNPAAMVYLPPCPSRPHLTPHTAAAFTSRRDFDGADAAMARVAAEKNLAETAFVSPVTDGTFALRWFTPASEV